MKLIGAGLATIGVSGVGVGKGIVFVSLLLTSGIFTYILIGNKRKSIWIVLLYITIYIVFNVFMGDSIYCMGSGDDDEGKRIIINNITNKNKVPGALTAAIVGATGGVLMKSPMHPIIKLGTLGISAFAGYGLEKSLIYSQLEVKQKNSRIVKNDTLEDWNTDTSIELLLLELYKLENIVIYFMIVLLIIKISNKIITEENIKKWIKNEKIRSILIKIYVRKKKIDFLWYVFIIINILVISLGINYFTLKIINDLPLFIEQYIRIKGIVIKNMEAGTKYSNLELLLENMYNLENIGICFMTLLLMINILNKIITEENIKKWIGSEKIRSILIKIFIRKGNIGKFWYVFIIINIFVISLGIDYLMINIINDLPIYVEQYMNVKGI